MLNTQISYIEWMRLKVFLFVASVSIIQLQAQTRIIFDTDFGGDADDLGALAILNNFVNKQECELLAVMCWNVEPYAVSAISSVNRFYGNATIPIGTRKGGGEYIPWNHSKVLSEKFPNDIDANSAPESTELYRKILSGSEDQSIIIVTVGPLLNIKNLLDSESDNNSPKSGKELVEEKVKEFVIMGGQFPKGEKEWNFDGNMPGVTRSVVERLNVPITFLGYEVGLNIKSGEVFNDLDESHPLFVGFSHFSEHCPWLNSQWQGRIYDNSTYDQTAVLYAVRGGLGEYWERIDDGYCQPDDTGGNEWVQGENDRDHSYLRLLKPVEEMATVIENFMVNDF